ncbi:MAG: hypothetical protein Q4C33_03185 [bacterium]|nr:hypothetical protein [bacterium]
MDVNKINNLNDQVHQSNDLDSVLAINDLLDKNGFKIKGSLGDLMDYCKNKGIDKVKENIGLLAKYDEELSQKKSKTDSFYSSIFSSSITKLGSSKSEPGILDNIERLVNSDTKYNIETDARYHDVNKPDNGKSIFTMRVEELKNKMGFDNTSEKLAHAKESLEKNYTAFRNLTAEDLKGPVAMKLRESIDQNRYYINQLQGMEQKQSFSIDSLESIAKFEAEVSGLSSFINGLKLTDETRKALIDEFAKLRTQINDYRAYIVGLQNTQRKFDSLLGEMKVEKSAKGNAKKASPKPATPKPSGKPAGAPEFNNDEIINVGDTVVFNGKAQSILNIGAPDGLVKGQEYKVEKIVIYQGLSYVKLEGFDKIVDIACFDKAKTKTVTPGGKQPEPAAPGTVKPAPEPPKSGPTPEPPKGGPSDEPSHDNGKKGKHDFKLKGIRKSSAFHHVAVVGGALLGLAATSFAFVPSLLIAGGAIATECIWFCYKRGHKLPNLMSLKQRFSEALDRRAQEMDDNEAEDARAVVEEIDNATKKVTLDSIVSGKITDEELKVLADRYIKEGKIKPGDYDKDTLKNMVYEAIFGDVKSLSTPGNSMNK